MVEEELFFIALPTGRDKPVDDWLATLLLETITSEILLPDMLTFQSFWSILVMKRRSSSSRVPVVSRSTFVDYAPSSFIPQCVNIIFYPVHLVVGDNFIQPLDKCKQIRYTDCSSRVRIG